MNGPSFVAGYALAHSIDCRRQHFSISGHPENIRASENIKEEE
jgi:hypothetical protein